MASAIENDYSVLSKTSALQQEQVRVCSLEIPKSSEMMFENINSWSFDIFTINDDDLPKLVEKVFINLSIFEYCLLDLKKVRTFINCIMAQYRSYVPYHNFRHACDVLHAVYLILTLTEAADKFSQLEKLALAIAAVCHDVDHPGLTNAFLIACNDPLALRYNDLAVLENHHASITMKTLLVADRILVPLYPRMNLEDHSRPSEMVVVERARPPVLDGQSLRAENQSLEKIRQATVENSQGFKISHGLLPSFSSQERPVSLLFGTPVQNYLPKLDSNVKGNASLRSTSLKLNRLPSSRLSMMSRHSLDSLPIAESSIRSESSIVSSYGDGTLDSKRNSLESIEDIGRTGFWENIRSNSYSMWLNRALDSNIWMSINIPATLVAIFAGDFIRAVLPKKVDLYEEPIYFACLFLFLLELIILSIVKKGYFVSFSFCLDLVGSLSLIPYALGTFKMTIIMARAWKAAKLITRMSKWMQTAKCLNVILVTRLFKMALTILTLGTVAAWSFFLSWDSNQLLIQPIERMVQFIRELADDPVSFVAKAKPQRANLRHIGEVMETKLLEAALVKIASLSKVALGNAGMDILSANLRGAEFNRESFEAI